MAQSRRQKQLHRDWLNAPDFKTWMALGAELDELDGRAEWRYEDASSEYDYRLVRARVDELRRLREDNRVRELVFVLHEGLHGNLGNIANPKLYGHCRSGTKILLESYLNEVAICLNYLCDNEFEDFPLDEKVLFFKRTGSSFGRSALMLSGGATLGMFHLGVIKALWHEHLLPRVISGSSAGSIIAGAVGTRTDEELDQALEPGGLFLEAWRMVDMRTAWKRRAFMDPVQLETCLAANLGEYTFEEAFEKTRRIVGITVSPVDAHQQGRLLNYLTAPNVLMRRASLASCSIPGVFPAVSLLAK
ncbi:MAG: patatin-like phospholipase family protein, partial [Oceanococcaceae bacterium]